MKKLFIYSLFFIINGCLVPGAPHGHLYRLIKSNNDIKVGIGVGCYPHDKTFSINTKIKNDSIKLCSKVFHNKCVLMDPPDTIIKRYHKTIRIWDHKFHKLFNKDTLKLLIYNNGKVTKLLYKSIPDPYTH